MNKNENLIRQIAEEMAIANYKHSDWDMADWEDEKNKFIAMSMPAARIAVKHSADAVDKALRGAGWKNGEERKAYLWFEGLIPEAGKEAAEDANS